MAFFISLPLSWLKIIVCCSAKIFEKEKSWHPQGRKDGAAQSDNFKSNVESIYLDSLTEEGSSLFACVAFRRLLIAVLCFDSGGNDASRSCCSQNLFSSEKGLFLLDRKLCSVIAICVCVCVCQFAQQAALKGSVSSVPHPPSADSPSVSAEKRMKLASLLRSQKHKPVGM